jgi:ADP-ribose pyrophosphatase
VTDRFRKVDERLIHQGAVVGFYDVTFAAPDGSEFHRDVVRHPGAVSVVALTDDDHVVMVRQFRAALEADLLEVVAGKRDVADEDPLVCAARELAEEVGYRAEHFELLATMRMTPGFCDEENLLYLATGLVEVERSVQGVEEQHMTIERVPLADVRAMIADGRIVDGKSLVGLLLALDRQEADRREIDRPGIDRPGIDRRGADGG